MKLTRGQLLRILERLPENHLVYKGIVPPVIQYPVYKMEIVKNIGTTKVRETTKTHQITFEFSQKEQDWVLKDLDF